MRVTVKNKKQEEIKINPVTGSIERFQDGEFVAMSSNQKQDTTNSFICQLGQFEPIPMTSDQLASFMMSLNTEEIKHKCNIQRKGNIFYIL